MVTSAYHYCQYLEVLTYSSIVNSLDVVCGIFFGFSFIFSLLSSALDHSATATPFEKVFFANQRQKKQAKNHSRLLNGIPKKSLEGTIHSFFHHLVQLKKFLSISLLLYLLSKPTLFSCYFPDSVLISASPHR